MIRPTPGSQGSGDHLQMDTQPGLFERVLDNTRRANDRTLESYSGVTTPGLPIICTR